MTDFMVYYPHPTDLDPIYTAIDPVDFLFEPKAFDTLMNTYSMYEATDQSVSSTSPLSTPMTTATLLSTMPSEYGYFPTLAEEDQTMHPPTLLELTPNSSTQRKFTSSPELPPAQVRRKKASSPVQSQGPVGEMQDTLDFLQDEWATIDIVLRSVKSAFTVYPERLGDDQYLDEVDRELSVAYDDLRAQIRSLDRNLKHLDVKMRTHQPPPHLG
ncbi:hypothetical protein DM01DRAFT_309618 [Hesseltinella vesiculosa]|uniref:Uncharacterized protein n=1 Tax=Hesseltinella vesiculosa TaxID=101127 RepID=A0A1X2GRH0_9FUNG|nr:hypothetical protein DM01DRAFT_309618 [Hesseltinella vesiculosa]